MKKTLILILILTLCLILVILLSKKSKYVVSDNLVSFRIAEESLTKSSATLILENHTDNSYRSGNWYLIEKEKNGTWYVLKPKSKPAFTLIAYILKPKEQIEINLNWENYYGELIPGKYRIIKRVALESSKPAKSSDYVYIGAEFIIE